MRYKNIKPITGQDILNGFNVGNIEPKKKEKLMMISFDRFVKMFGFFEPVLWNLSNENWIYKNIKSVDHPGSIEWLEYNGYIELNKETF